MSDEPSVSEPQTAAPESLPAPTDRAPEPAPAAAKEPPEASPPAPPDSPPGDGSGNGAAPEPSKKNWYVVKVQSGREESIKDAIERRVKIEGLEEFFGQVLIPVEKVVEMRNGKRVTRQRKLYPGYLMVEVEYNDRILYLFRETSGVGDFVGAAPNKAPQPMPTKEVARITAKPGDKPPREDKITYEKGDRVKVKEGPFAGMEGEIKEVLDTKDKVRVELTIWGRPVPVELELWGVEKA
jgi:transcription termination/antitermination protein NusG